MKRSPEIEQAIVDGLAKGTPLTVICRKLKIDRSTCRKWRAEDPAWTERFLTARDEGHDAIADRLRATARGFGPERGGCSSGDIARDKLIIDTDLKLLAKWDKRYTDKVTHVGGGEGEPAIKHDLQVSFVTTNVATTSED